MTLGGWITSATTTELSYVVPPPKQLSYFFTAPSPMVEVDLQHSTSTTDSVTSSIPSFHVVDRPTYAQLYIYDLHKTLEHRVQWSTTLDPVIMEFLQTPIPRHHCWAQNFKHAQEVFEHNCCEDISQPRLTSLEPCTCRRFYSSGEDSILSIFGYFNELDHVIEPEIRWLSHAKVRSHSIFCFSQLNEILGCFV